MNRGLIIKDLEYRQDDFFLSLSLSLEEGHFGCLIGPSGCGKTTLLHLIGGFLDASNGSIQINGRDIGAMDPHKRNLGIVFQDYALFPHLSVEDNIAYGLKSRKTAGADRKDIQSRVEELLALVKMPGYGNRKISSLSGGEQQRIALARALAPRPELLLLDEPLSALDGPLRGQLRKEIRRIQEELGITTLYITHDHEEALTLSDRVFLMNQGALVQEGTPEELYQYPRTLFSGEFLGRSNRLSGEVSGVTQESLLIKTSGGALTLDNRKSGTGPPVPGTGGILFFRPEDIAIHRNCGDEPGTLKGVIKTLEYYGSQYLAEVSLDETQVMVVVPLGTSLERGDRVCLSLQPNRGRWFALSS